VINNANKLQIGFGIAGGAEALEAVLRMG